MVKILEPLKVNGFNRISPKLEYETNNVISCCSKCNYGKHEMTKNDFF